MCAQQLSAYELRLGLARVEYHLKRLDMQLDVFALDQVREPVLREMEPMIHAALARPAANEAIAEALSSLDNPSLATLPR